MSSVAILVTFWIAPYWQQATLISELRDKNVYVHSVYDGPEQLAWCLRDRSILVRPVQAQVLLQPDSDDSVKLLGKVVQVADLHQELKELRARLRNRLGLDSFSLVVGFQSFPDHILTRIFRQEIQAAKESKVQPFYHLTPCGIENFRHVRTLQPEAFGK
jgi:hypothetical protein